MVLLSVLMLCTSKNALFLWHIKYTQACIHSSLKDLCTLHQMCHFCRKQSWLQTPCQWTNDCQKVIISCLCFLDVEDLKSHEDYTELMGLASEKKYRRLNIQSFHLHCCCLWWTLVQIKWNIIVLSDASNHTPGPIGEAFGNKGVNNPGRFTCLPSGDGL